MSPPCRTTTSSGLSSNEQTDDDDFTPPKNSEESSAHRRQRLRRPATPCVLTFGQCGQPLASQPLSRERPTRTCSHGSDTPLQQRCHHLPLHFSCRGGRQVLKFSGFCLPPCRVRRSWSVLSQVPARENMRPFFAIVFRLADMCALRHSVVSVCSRSTHHASKGYVPVGLGGAG